MFSNQKQLGGWSVIDLKKELDGVIDLKKCHPCRSDIIDPI